MKIFNSIIKYSRLLEEVDLSENLDFGDVGTETISKNLGRNKSITLLRLKNTNISDKSAEVLK
jgi:hypothetical protein